MRLLPLPGVFKPPSDSWMLAHRLGQEPLHERSRVLDVCAGSGVLAVLAAMRVRSGVTAVDISRRAVLATRLNAKLNRVTVTALRGDLFLPVGDARFDLIISNPPYLPTPGGELPPRGLARAWEGGPAGRAYIDRICAEAAEHLRPSGVLLLVHSSVCGERETLAALGESGLRTEVAVRSRGPLGPRLRARADWLRAHDLVLADGCEEILVIRAQRPCQ
jgi:release factor glutamine methyltransferase